MSFVTPKSEFTHYARFYLIPIYMNPETNAVAGRNLVFDYLLLAAVWFHNQVTERFAQTMAAFFGCEYECGLHFVITGEINDENLENQKESE